jgi:hypothetical protein
MLIEIGTQVITNRWLPLIREEFSLSMVCAARLMGTYAATVKTWDDGSTTSVWKQSARKVARFYLGYLDTVGKLNRAGISPKDLLPVSTASMYLGKPTQSVMQQCQAGTLTCLDLGTLGSFVWRRDVGR